MRRFLVTGCAGCLLAALLVLVLPPAVNAAPSDVLHDASQSIVKVEAGSSAATGFIWVDSSHVVTSLHVVDGNGGQATVHYVNRNGQIMASTPASVEKVLKASDLVLLSLSNPQDRTPLQINTSAPQVKQTLDAVGFPLNIAGISNTEVKVRFGGNQLRSILPPKVLNTIRDYPSTTEEILNLEGNLVPGLSGAPIIDGSGHVVGIVNGGLENGAVGISWGIPAKYLVSLQQSSVSQLPGTKGIAELFAADLQAEVGKAQELGDGSFLKLRSRTFAQLAATADDQLGLSQLASLFSMFDPYSFRYDIYQDTESGATVVVPEGAELSLEGEFAVASVGDPRMRIKFVVAEVEDIFDAQLLSMQFETLLTNPDGMGQVFPDPQWSYAQPMVGFGVTVNRKAVMRNVVDGYAVRTDKYYFETLASNGEALLAVAAVNENNTPQMLEAEMACAQGWAQFDCSQLMRSRKVWAQMVLAVQFASFPQMQLE